MDSHCVGDPTAALGISSLPSTQNYPSSQVYCQRDCAKEKEEEAPATVWREDHFVDGAGGSRLVCSRTLVAAGRAAATPPMTGHTATIPRIKLEERAALGVEPHLIRALRQTEHPNLDAVRRVAEAATPTHPRDTDHPTVDRCGLRGAAARHPMRFSAWGSAVPRHTARASAHRRRRPLDSQYTPPAATG
jgi:hypothetical protein